MFIETFGFVGSTDKPSFVRGELRVERGYHFRLSRMSVSAAKALQARLRSALIACGYKWPESKCPAHCCAQSMPMRAENCEKWQVFLLDRGG